MTRRPGEPLREWLDRQRLMQTIERHSQASLETFPGTSQGRALPASPISREGGPAVPGVTIRRGGPAGEYLMLTGSQSVASGGQSLSADAVVKRVGFASTTGPGATWTFPRTASYGVKVWFEWDTYRGGGAVEVLINGSRFFVDPDDGGGVGGSGSGVFPVFANKDDTGAVKVTQSSGSAQDATFTIAVYVIEPKGVTTTDVCPLMGTPVTVVDDTSFNGFPGYTIAADGTHVLFYRSGTNHTSNDGDLIKRTSSDGITWSAASTFLSADATYEYLTSSLTRLDNDNLILAVRRRDHSAGGNDALVYTSSDNGSNWTLTGTATHNFTNSGIVAGAVLELDNGDLLLPAYGTDTGDTNRSSRVLKSTDSGANWTTLATVADGPTDSVDYNEVGLFLFNSEVVALIRHDSGDNSGADYYRATSADSGATWSTPNVVLPSAGGMPRPLVRADGTVVVAFRDKDSGTFPDYPTRLAVSGDGANWTRCAALPPLTGRQSTYAQQAEDSNGRLFVAYGEENAAQDDSDINVAAEGA